MAKHLGKVLYQNLALALGLINVIIREKLYDEYFVENWAVGFAELKQHVIPYSPEEE